ncbi:hypothetical protein Hdeb2414_s0021g00577401 [Helianthus debilis subsp. tardiflorus]
MELAQGGAGRCGRMDRDYLLNTYDVLNINTYVGFNINASATLTYIGFDKHLSY